MKAKVSSMPSSVVGRKNCGVSPTEAGNVDPDAHPSYRTLSASEDVSVAALRELTIATDFDPLFHARFGSATNGEIAARVSAASVIYERDLGIVLRIEAQNGYTSGSPYTSTDPSTRLSQFREDRDRFSLRGAVDAQILFSGVDFDGSTVGIAYVNVTCRLSGAYSYGIIQYVSPTLDYLILAHELGHNLGVQNHTSTGIMSAVLNGSSSFSTDARSLIGDYINVNGGCLTAPGGQPTVTPTPVPTSTPSATPTNAGSVPEPGVPLPTAIPTLSPPGAGPTVTPTVVAPSPPSNAVITLARHGKPKIVVRHLRGKRTLVQQAQFRGAIRHASSAEGFANVRLDVWVGNTLKTSVLSETTGEYSFRLNLPYAQKSIVQTTFLNGDSTVASSNAVTVKRSGR
jgi:Metallo-peptidase family M12